MRYRYRNKSPERWRAQGRKDAKLVQTRRRALALAAYGGKCVCCGEATPEFLELDHVKNDGKAHRASLGRRAGSQLLLRWLVQHDFPPGILQVLCANCHRAKTSYGGCPHRRSLT